jgi:hypothetical protein
LLLTFGVGAQPWWVAEHPEPLLIGQRCLESGKVPGYPGGESVGGGLLPGLDPGALVASVSAIGSGRLAAVINGEHPLSVELSEAIVVLVIATSDLAFEDLAPSLGSPAFEAGLGNSRDACAGESLGISNMTFGGGGGGEGGGGMILLHSGLVF